MTPISNEHKKGLIITMNYCLHEALRLMLEEGLENHHARHEQNYLLLKNGLAEIELKILLQSDHQLWQISDIGVPAGVDELAVRKERLADLRIEISVVYRIRLRFKKVTQTIHPKLPTENPRPPV